MKNWGLSTDLDQRQESGLFRKRQTIESPQGTHVTVNGEPLLAFCSNDYLGLANHPKMIEACIEGLNQYGTGAGASHLVSGHFEPHHNLELALAKYTDRERALVFTSGYQANLGIITSFLDRRDQIFQDRLNHASLLDAGLLSGAKFRRYPHKDYNTLRNLLEKASGRRIIVATDGVFSMDGDVALLPELAELCQQYNACLMIDDAHGFGVLGQHGAGSIEHFKMESHAIPLLMGTLSKSLGLTGAFVAGDGELIETILQKARSYIYTTALPPAYAFAALTALKLMRNSDIRDTLFTNIQHFKKGAKELQLNILPSNTAIQPLVLGSCQNALLWAKRLRSEGILVPAIRHPTVPNGSARLRITLSATHSKSDINRLLSVLNQLQQSLVT